MLSIKDIFDILQRGIQQRQTAATLCNKNSSRSHSIFTMKIMIKECNVDGEECIRHGQLNLVDLAGSECVGRSGAKNDRAREAGSINQSLLTLGRVITALVDHHGHIPYRDSKLTRILQESLGGKAKTCIIATLSPSQSAVEETLSTLDYAHRAKNIKNQPTVNQKMTKKVVLKEYCAEIEQLRSQLQLTREKNGVYVDPKEYYDMENKIATQENMLQECEAALKIRNDEVKIMKNERDGFVEKIDAATTELSAITVQLETMTETLDKTVKTLESKKVELKAVEAVVIEQIYTEDQLLVSGSNLQSEVVSRRHDIDLLIAKVDKLADKESVRLHETSVFASSIQHSNDTLLSSVSQLKDVGSSSSKELCDGVSEMLHRGRSTCSSLKGAIDAALSTLLVDAETARDHMTSSCDSVSSTLHSTNKNLQQTLSTLKDQLSNWLGEVDGNLSQIQVQLSQQQSQLLSLSSTIEHKSKAMIDSHQEYANKQVALSIESIDATAALRDSISSSLTSHDLEVQATINDTNNAMAVKASQLEKTMSNMIQEFLSANTVSLSAIASASSEFSTLLISKTNSDIDGIISVGNNQQKMIRDDAEASTARMLESSSSSVTDIHSIGNTRDTVTTMIDTISSTVDSKRQLLDHTVVEIINDVDTSIVTACNTVDETSATANAIMKDVARATESMKASTDVALTDFTAYMDSKGDNLCTNMTTYFNTVDVALDAQYNEIVSADEHTSAYADIVNATIYQPTGATPKKRLFNELGQLPKTRSHSLIKKEVVESIANGADVSGTNSDASGFDTVAEAIVAEPVVVTTASAPVVAPVVVPVVVPVAVVGNCENSNPNKASNKHQVSKLVRGKSANIDTAGGDTIKVTRSNSAMNT